MHCPLMAQTMSETEQPPASEPATIMNVQMIIIGIVARAAPNLLLVINIAHFHSHKWLPEFFILADSFYCAAG